MWPQMPFTNNYYASDINLWNKLSIVSHNLEKKFWSIYKLHKKTTGRND